MDPLVKHSRIVTAVAFSPDGRTVLTGSHDGMAQLWRVEDGSPIGNAVRHGAAVRAVAFSPNGRTVLSGSDDGIACLWQVEEGSIIDNWLQHKTRVRGAAFSPDGITVLTGSHDGKARLWRVEDGAPIGKAFEHGARDGTWVTAVAFSPDGRIVATGGRDAATRLWRTEDGVKIGKSLLDIGVLATVTGVAFGADGQTVLTSRNDGTVRVWQAYSADLVAELLTQELPIHTMEVSAHGRYAAFASDRRIHLARLDEKKLSETKDWFFPYTGKIRGLHFADNTGQRLYVVTGIVDERLQVITLNANSPPTDRPIQGDPKDLLDEWQKKLGLRINAAGKLVNE